MSTLRIVRLPAAERSRVAEALVLVVCVRIGLRVMAYPQLARLLDRRARSRPAAPDDRARIIWAARAVTRRVPGTTCLAEALTAHTMLRRHGHAATLRLGARAGADARIAAHAWVECGDQVVIGRVPEIQEYAVLT